jgi:hypothetical protein
LHTICFVLILCCFIICCCFMFCCSPSSALCMAYLLVHTFMIETMFMHMLVFTFWYNIVFLVVVLHGVVSWWVHYMCSTSDYHTVLFHARLWCAAVFLVVVCCSVLAVVSWWGIFLYIMCSSFDCNHCHHTILLFRARLWSYSAY